MANEANFLRVYIVFFKFLFNWSCKKERQIYLKEKKKNKTEEKSVHRHQDYLSAASGSASAPTSALDADPRNLLGSYRNNRKLSVWFVKTH